VGLRVGHACGCRPSLYRSVNYTTYYFDCAEQAAQDCSMKKNEIRKSNHGRMSTDRSETTVPFRMTHLSRSKRGISELSRCALPLASHGLIKARQSTSPATPSMSRKGEQYRFISALQDSWLYIPKYRCSKSQFHPRLNQFSFEPQLSRLERQS
jgi:hypothetical protein